MKQSLYYQANVRKHDCWFFVSVLKSFEHLVFDRTLDKEQGLFEFFVSEDLQEPFEELLAWFSERGAIMNLKKLPNRLVSCNQND